MRVEGLGLRGSQEAGMGALADLNATQALRFEEILKAVCHSMRWVREMESQRPFADGDDLRAKGQKAWAKTGVADWKEALLGHPRIGERQRGESLDARWSRAEQSAAAKADVELKARLSARQKDYEARFGFLFLICASGRSSEQILQALEERILHDSEHEWQVVGAELAKIIDLRLEKLVS